MPSHESVLKSIHVEHSSDKVIKCSKLLMHVDILKDIHMNIHSFLDIGNCRVNLTIHFGSTPLDFPSPSLKLSRTLSTKNKIVTSYE